MMLKNQRYTFFDEFGKAEELLQAVIIADLFDGKLSPISLTIPVSLIPIANKRAIDYTIEMLLNSGLQRILIVTSLHSEQISSYLTSSRYFTQGYGQFEVIRLNPDNIHSIGDVLRELDRDPRSHLRGEFIICSGLTIGRMDLRRLIERHLERRLKDDRILLTAIFDRRPKGFSLKDYDQDIYLASDPHTGEILNLEPKIPDSISVRSCQMIDRSSFSVHFDLCYSGIYFMDVRALQLFQDNFDCQSFDEIIRNIIGNDLLQKYVCFDVVSDGYIGNIRNFKQYHGISFDVVRRWSYPLTVDKEGYSLHSNHVYISEFTHINQTVQLRSDVVIGENTTVLHKAILERCIIGSNCSIGSNVIIKDSIIWSRVRIEADCVIENSIICDDVVILKGSEIGEGCVLSFRVTVGPNAVLPPRSIVHISSNTREVFSSSFIDLGDASKGSIFRICDSDIHHYDWGLPPLTSHHDQTESDDHFEKLPVLDDYCDFYPIVRDTIILGLDDQVSLDTIITEINVSKHLYNISQDQVLLSVCDTMVEYCFPPRLDQDKMIQHIQKCSQQMAPFCNRYFHTSKSRNLLLLRLEDFIYKSGILGQFYSRLILDLYFNDILDVNFISDWLLFEDENFDSERKEFRSEKIQKILNWILAQASESDDSDSSENSHSDSN